MEAPSAELSAGGVVSNVIDWLDTYRLPTGRRLFAFRQIKELAVKLKDKSVERLAAAAVAHDEATYLAEMNYAARPKNERYDPEMEEVDRLADEFIQGLNATLLGLRGGRRAKDPVYQLSQSTQKSLFPDGTAAVTLLPYPLQLEAMKALSRLLHGELANAVAQFRLEDKRQLLDALTAEYEEVLMRPQPGRTDFSKVRELRITGLEYLARLVVKILDQYGEPTPEHRARRAELLAPVEAQNDAVQKYMKGRRGVAADINPETGEDVPDQPVVPA